jgi:hypothetical protein
MAEPVAPRQDAVTDQLRIKYGFWVAVIGLLVVAGVFIVAVLRWNTAADVTTVVGSVTGVVGTVVGAFFGLNVGAAGKEKAEAERKEAESTALRLAAALPPNEAARIMAVG